MALPVRLQDTSYSCGAAALQSVLAYLGVQAGEGQLAQALGTDSKAGTDPAAIVALARHLGLAVEDRSGLSLADVAHCLARGVPVLCAVQMHGGGHWVVAVGVEPAGVLLMDPIDGMVRVPPTDFEEAWHDTDSSGRRLDRYGLAIGSAGLQEGGVGSNQYQSKPGGKGDEPAAQHTSPESSKAVATWTSATGGAWKKISSVFSPSQDTCLGDIMRESGRTGAPNVISKADLDTAINGGERELFRGVTERNQADKLRNGPCFVGRGIYGNGIYFCSNEAGSHAEKAGGADQVARGYATGKGAVIRASLKKDAVVREYDDLKKEQGDYLAGLREKAGKATGGDRGRLNRQIALESDIGRYAVLRNIDAITVKDMGYVNMLNRTALRIQDTNH